MGAAGACFDGERAVASVRGVLPPDERVLVEQHAYACSACRPLLEQARSTFVQSLADGGRCAAEFAGTERFRVLRRLGEGGMGVVYEALDLDSGARMALKTIAARSSGSLLRFKHEFRALRGIEHPNLVRLGELMQDAGRWFFTMELIEGVDFLEHVRGDRGRAGDADTDEGGRRGGEVCVARAGRCDEVALRQSLEQLVHGLLALHRAGKVHRDVKPSNILVTPAGRVAVLDFGLVADVTFGPSGGGDLAGTVAFMAPEQGTCAPITPAADWYSVGMLLYLALTGRVPFAGPPPEVLALKRTVDPIAPRTIVPSVPPDLDELCMALLRREPESRPSGRQVLQWLRAAAPASLEEPEAAPRFVGRREPLRALQQALDDVATGRALSVLIEGESGVGKTALVRELCERVRGDGVLVLSGRCYERESVPYKAFDEIVDALSRFLTELPPDERAPLLPADMGPLAQIFPVLAPLAERDGPPPAGEPQQLRRALFATLREILRRIAARRLTLLHIDDLHWADEESLLLLEALLESPAAPPLLLLATLRREAGVPVDALAARLPGELRRLALDTLPPDEARLLAAQLLGAAPAAPPAVDEVALEAGGHPLFIEALVQHRLLAGGDPGPVRLEQALAARIARLPDGARRLLEAVAVAGGPLEQDVAAAAVDLEWSELERQLAFLRASFLVRSTGARPSDRVESYHDRVREAVTTRLDARAERDWHARLAGAFERQDRGDAETLAMHFRAAGERARAARYFALAADRAAKALAFDRAARLYRECLALHGGASAETGALQVKLGDALANAGRGEAAARAYETAAAVEPAAMAAIDLRRRAAEQLMRVGRLDEAMALLGSVMAAVGLRMPTSPAAALAELVARMAQLRLRRFRFRERAENALSPLERARIDTCWSIGVGLSSIDHIRGAVFQERHLLLALRGGEPYRVARAFIVESFLLSTRGPGSVRLAARLIDEAEAIAARIGSPHLNALVCMARALMGQFSGRFRFARARWDEAEQLLARGCTQVAWERTNVGFFQLQTLGWLGELNELSRRLPLMLDSAQARDDRYSGCVLRTGWNVLPGLAADDPVATRAAVSEAVARWPSGGLHIQHALALHSHAQLALYEGRGDAARTLLDRHWPALGRALLLEVRPLRVDLLSLRMRCALACADGRAGTAARLAEAEQLARRIADNQQAWSTPLAQLGLAAVAARRRRPEAALALLERARAGFAAASMGLFAAAALRARGQLVGGLQGREQCAAADRMLAAQGVRRPDRLAALLAPGF